MSAEPGASSALRQMAVPFVPVTPIETRDLMVDLAAVLEACPLTEPGETLLLRVPSWILDHLDLDEATGLARSYGWGRVRLEPV